MKNILLSCFFMSGIGVSAQEVIFEENWDGSGPGLGAWTVIDGDGLAPALTYMTDGWLVRDRGDGHGGPSGNHAAVSTSWYEPIGTANDWLISPTFTIDGDNPFLVWEAKAQDPTARDRYRVMLSPTGGEAVEDFTVTLKTIDPEDNSQGLNPWKERRVDLSQYKGQNVRIAFVNDSFDKYLLLIDNIVVHANYQLPPLPDCVVDVHPENNATGIAADQTLLEWKPAATGGEAVSYRVYMGSDPDHLQDLGIVNETKVLINGTRYNTTYYWKLVASNGVGSSPDNCPIFSFTTGDNQSLPYCGPIRYTFIEPISRVSFSDLDNETSPVNDYPSHEFHLDKIAHVERNKTYTLRVQGNTLGDYSNRIIVFIDWNQDGQFTDHEVMVIPESLSNSTGQDGKEVAMEISVPSDAVLGNTRMRIKKFYGQEPHLSPCDATVQGWFSGGQTEDYTVNISQGHLGTSELKASQIHLYPNPVSDLMNVSSRFEMESLKIYDLTGKFIREHVLTSKTSMIDLSYLPQGQYMVVIHHTKGKESVKIIKK